MSSFLDDSGKRTLEVAPAHIGSDQHAPRPSSPPQRMYGDGLPLWASKLAAIFGLAWCEECGDFHEIAGGPSQDQRGMMSGPAASSSIAGGDGAPPL